MFSRIEAAMETPSGALFNEASRILNDIEIGLGDVHDLEGLSIGVCAAMRAIKDEQHKYTEEQANEK